MPFKSTKPPPREDTDLAFKVLQNPLLTYAPTKVQAEFMQLTNFVQVFSAANWSGKTCTGIIKLAASIWPSPNVFLSHLRFRFPKNSQGRIVSSHTSIDQMIVPEIHKWFPKTRYTSTKGTRSFESRFKTDTGVTFDLMTYDQDPREFESVKLDFVLFDEPPPYRIFNATVARMKPNGIIFIVMTPLSEAAYLFDRISNPWTEHSKSWGTVYADIESACITHGVNGYLPHATIEQKMAEYSPEEREARISGRPMHLSGLVYKTFSRPVHVIPPIPIPSDATIYNVCDPHDRKPYALGWYFVTPQEKAYCFDEYPNEPFHNLKSSRLTVADYAQIIRAKEAEHRLTDRPITRIIDARFAPKPSAQTGTTVRDMFDSHGLHFLNSYTDNGGSIAQGHDLVRNWLQLKADGKPSLQIFDTCFNHIYGFEHYTYDDYLHPEEQGVREKVKDVHKDFMDLVRYFLGDDPRCYVTPTDASHTDTTVPPERWKREGVSAYGF